MATYRIKRFSNNLSDRINELTEQERKEKNKNRLKGDIPLAGAIALGLHQTSKLIKMEKNNKIGRRLAKGLRAIDLGLIPAVSYNIYKHSKGEEGIEKFFKKTNKN